MHDRSLLRNNYYQLRFLNYGARIAEIKIFGICGNYVSLISVVVEDIGVGYSFHTVPLTNCIEMFVIM